MLALQQIFLFATGADENYVDVSLEKKISFYPRLVERNSSQSFLISVKRLFSS